MELKSLFVVFAVIALLMGGEVQAFDRPCWATEAAPSFNEGDSVPCSVDKTGSQRMHSTKLAGGEHVDNTSEDLGYQRTVGGMVRSITAMTGVTTNTTSASFTIPTGSKTPIAQVSGTGAVTATVKLYGDNDSTAANGILLCTVTLTDTTKDVDKCDQFTVDYPHYYATSENVTGTDATVEFIVAVGIAGSGTGGVGGGDASAANQTTMITALQLIDNIVSGSGANISQINGVTPLMGAGNTGTGSPRVTIVTDQAALPGMGVYVEDAAETAGGNLSMAGSVRRDVAAASATTTGDNATINTDALGLTWTRLLDPCSGIAKTHIPISISTATTTELTPSLAGASTHYYVCSIDLVTAAANNVALVDDDSDGCGSITSGLAGGVTAATGWNFAANGGLTKGNGNGTVFKTGGTNRVICLMTSATTQLSGSIQVVAAP